MLGIAGTSAAQVPAFFEPPSAEARKKLPVVKVATPPTIDGVLDDEAWKGATESGEFVQIEPKQGERATHKTRVRVVFDDDALYVSAELEQPGGTFSFNQRDMRRDFQPNECDQFATILDTLGDSRNAFVFSVNPFGAQRDVQVIDDELAEPNWDTVWRAATTRSENGWKVEVAIPWKSIRYGPPDTTWGVQFYRRERGLNEDTVYSPIPRSVSPARMQYSAAMQGLVPPRPSLLSVQLRPYLIGRLEKIGDGPVSALPSGGGEVTWKPNSNTVIDLTGNTDFAETDVDRRVVNLSRFNVFFPERRQFFLESAGVFSAGFQGFLQPFFSRRIGLDDDGRAVPITAGARAVYRAVDQSAGAMVVHTLQTPGANSSIFGVARYSRNVGEQSRLGGMVVARHDFEGPVGESVTNVVPVIDGLFRFGPVTVTPSLMGSVTAPKGKPTRFGGVATLDAYVQGNWGSLGTSLFGISPDFDARAGFLARTDVIGGSIHGGLDLRPDWLPSVIRNFGPFIDSYALWQSSSLTFLEANAYFSPWWMQFSGGDETWIYAEHSEQVLLDPFQPVQHVEFAPGHYSYERMGAAFQSQNSRKVAGGIDVAGGTYYTASVFNGSARLSVQPIPHVSLSANYTYNRFWGRGVQGAFSDTHLLLLETRLALSPKLQLIGSYQRDTDGNVSVLNARLAWEFLPLSFVYVVVTDTRNAYPAPGTPPSEFRVVAKATYTWRL
ncbi:MAG: DUF5916 domain-containing protein [Myxococcaceae bacterium]